ncbi:MAG: peptidoglycan D,D-transpeptidase FtsI family protein [Clostridia bacterium]|jgi:penicillin-binding protein 2
MDKRILSIGMTGTALIFLLMARLWNIQINHSLRMSQEVVRQRIVEIPLSERRGNFLDRKGVPFTGNSYQTELIIFPSMMAPPIRSKLELISFWTGLNTDKIMEQIQSRSAYIRLKAPNIPIDDRKKLLDGKEAGMILVDQPVRYDENSLARHVIGYINSTSQTGAEWLEKELDEILKPTGGKVIYCMLDARGKMIPGIGYRIHQPKGDKPNDVMLTLDFHIQKIVEEEMDRCQMNGAVVVTEAATGDILALASCPNYDQNNFKASMEGDGSLLNKALIPTAPGSIFKLVVLAAALEEGGIQEEEIFHCTGGILLGNHFVGCHESSGGLGRINLEEALAYSCNDTFIKIAQRLGADPIVQTAQRLGCTDSVQIGLPYERKGELPDKETYAGNGIGNLAIGQGEVALSPLHIAEIIGTIINGGYRRKLRLIKALPSENNNEINQISSTMMERVLKEDTAIALKEYMDRVTSYGTGMEANDNIFGGSGSKTGTPQVMKHGKISNNGWFAGYFPRKDPQYIIVVFMEDVESGGKACGPVFRNIARKIHEYEERFIMQ